MATRNLAKLEFADRIRQFSEALRSKLPESVPVALSILTESLPELLPDCEDVTDGWLQWPIGQFIADHGLDCYDESMSAMIELTQRFSSEFAVRPFVEKYPRPTFKKLLALTKHPSAMCDDGVPKEHGRACLGAGS